MLELWGALKVEYATALCRAIGHSRTAGCSHEPEYTHVQQTTADDAVVTDALGMSDAAALGCH